MSSFRLIEETNQRSNWKWPDIDGFDKFKGKLIHSAAWDESYDFSGKKVAVIGNGSSAIQIIPKLAQSTPASLFMESYLTD